MPAMTPTPAAYACRRHPTVAVTMNIPARTFCARCGKPLRRVEGAAAAQSPKEPQDAQ